MNLGIDLGTSYSSVAAEVNGKIEMIRVATGASAFGDSFSIPTAVYLDEGHMLLGQAALNRRKLSPSCFKSEFKRDFGTSTPFVLGDEEYLPEQLYTELFLYFKNQAVEQIGEKIDKAYITHPANYGNNKKRLIEKAANNAGLFDIVLVDEPTAAAAGYSQKSRINEGDILLVYDLGGGTFDVALIKKTQNGYVHLTEPVGISNCGGVDFDRVIFEDILQKMNRSGEFDMGRLMKEKRFAASLSEISIQIKHQLSQVDVHTEPIAVGFDYFDYKITRQEFEERIYPYAANTCEKVKDILKNSGLSSSDIDRVLLVGGSSRVPLIKKMVHDTLKKDIHLDADPELAICQGAASIGMRQKVEDASGSIQGKGYTWAVKSMKDKKTQEMDNEILQYPESTRRLMVSVKLGTYPEDGSWIYYSNKDVLFKVKKDGTEKTILSYNKVWISPIRADERWVYYLVNEGLFSDGSFSLYKIKKDGTEETKISREKVYNYFTICDQWIYFITGSALKKMRTDGTSVRTLDNERYSSLSVADNWIYCVNNMGIYRINIDGTSKTQIIKGNFGSLAVSGSWIFYNDHNDGNRICKIRIDGTQNYRICGDRAGTVNICGGWLYYRNLDDEKCYRISLDGGNPQLVG